MEAINIKDGYNCASCLNQVDADGYVSALGQNWHKECFRCSVCDILLSTWYFEKSGMLFCKDDYWARFGESCQHCAQVITGPVMSAGAHRFHPECFACAACGAHIEDGESYALVERSKLYCGGCYHKEGSYGGTGHSIRALTVPRDGLIRQCDKIAPMQLQDKLAMLAGRLYQAVLSICLQITCQRVDSCGLLTLQLGDRILEINGTPVRHHAVQEIERVLACPDTILQLTIEHDPDTIGSSQSPTCPPSTVDSKLTQELVILESESNKQTKCHIPNNIPKDTENISKTDCSLKMRLKDNSIARPNIGDGDESQVKKERLFKRKGEGTGKSRVIKRRQTPSSPLLGDKEKSSSMSKLLDAVDHVSNENVGVLCDLSRARSFRAHHDTGQKVFRASDLLQGELLGSGFFGEVYRVTHQDTGEVMVLKQLYRVDEDAQRNFLKEVAVLRSLSHPNVLHFIGVLYKDKRLHLVTEYVAGGTLHELLQDCNILLSWHERVRLARDIAAGVGYLHRMNVIHRDLNSHNCLVREDKTVIVADFGLARIVQRTASSAPQPHHHATLRRKRYTVVGNPYWMAPEMMNGNLYDEKVDVFSFGIILCEIIGRVQADPDFLPRRMDFGLNETQFLEKFCDGCPEPFYRIAFLACDLDPDHRPPFEVTEIWLESLVMHLAKPGPLPATLLVDILQYAHRDIEMQGHATPECCSHEHTNIFCMETPECCKCRKCSSCAVSRSPSKHVVNVANELQVPEHGVIKSKSNAMVPHQDCISRDESANGRALGKCVSASHICQSQRPIVTVTNFSRSQNTLANTPSGYIVRADGKNINITKVDNITEWLDPPPPLKRTSPACLQLNNLVQEQSNKARKLDEISNESEEYNSLPSFLRNQSVEGLESQSKHDIDAPLPFCRHISIPDNSDMQNDDTDSSDSMESLKEAIVSKSAIHLEKKMNTELGKNIIGCKVKRGDGILEKKATLNFGDVIARNPECMKGHERKFPEADYRRYNIDYVTKNPIMAKALKNIPNSSEEEKHENVEKPNSLAKKLLPPKLSRFFKPASTEEMKHKVDADENKEEKSRSKFFIQRPTSPSNISRSYRVRPIEEIKVQQNCADKKKPPNNLLKSDIKLANMGKPMTPIFRRNIPSERNDFMDGRFSYRDRRHNKYDGKSNEQKSIYKSLTPNIKTDIKGSSPLIRSNQSNNIPALSHTNKPIHSINNNVKKLDDKDDVKRREHGINRSNYVSLANLKINAKTKSVGGNKESVLSVPLELYENV